MNTQCFLCKRCRREREIVDVGGQGSKWPSAWFGDKSKTTTRFVTLKRLHPPWRSEKTRSPIVASYPPSILPSPHEAYFFVLGGRRTVNKAACLHRPQRLSSCSSLNTQRYQLQGLNPPTLIPKMSFVSQKFIPSGTYIIINAKYDLSIAYRDDCYNNACGMSSVGGKTIQVYSPCFSWTIRTIS